MAEEEFQKKIQQYTVQKKIQQYTTVHQDDSVEEKPTNTVITNIAQSTETFIVFLCSPDCSPSRSLPVFIGKYPHLCRAQIVSFDRDRRKDGSRYILWNPEQCSIKKTVDELVEAIFEFPPEEVWDCSSANLSILQKALDERKKIVETYEPISRKYPKLRHVPILSLPQTYLEKLRRWRRLAACVDPFSDVVRFPHDVGFCGLLSPRRCNIFEELAKGGISVCVLQNCWGEERDQMLAGCKLLVNIHYDETYEIFECARCEPWLQIGVPVVSETSLENDPRAIVVPYPMLVSKIIQTLLEKNRLLF